MPTSMSSGACVCTHLCLFLQWRHHPHTPTLTHTLSPFAHPHTSTNQPTNQPTKTPAPIPIPIHTHRTAGPQQYVFEEMAQTAANGFRFLSKQPPISYASALATRMHKYPPNHFISGPSVRPSVRVFGGCVCSFSLSLSGGLGCGFGSLV
jgi:hypothetical protein